MKSKTFVMMFLAIGCGLVAAYLTARLTAKGTTQNTVPVLVAKEKIKAGDMLKEPEKLFVEMQYPVGTTPNAISSMEALKNKMVNKSVQPGQWLTPDDLSSNFGIELPKGHYAMAVKVDPASAAGGFILPRSKVNVLISVKGRSGLQDRIRVMTVLQDVLVLAVDQTTVRQDDKMAVAQLSTATLAVKPGDSQRLALAQTMAGEHGLRLVLRANDDEDRVPLQPLDRIDSDNSSGDGFSNPNGGQTFKVAVAKDNITAGQVVENPDDLFEVKELPFAPEKAILAEGIADLKGKTVTTSIFKDTVATAGNFDGKTVVKAGSPKKVASKDDGSDSGDVVAEAPKISRHVMFIQNGGGAPQKHVFSNGIAEGPDVAGSVIPTPPSSEAPSANAEEKPATPADKTPKTPEKELS